MNSSISRIVHFRKAGLWTVRCKRALASDPWPVDVEQVRHWNKDNTDAAHDRQSIRNAHVLAER